ncbi:DUF2066 domain-containing protein [Pseudoxanthomonas sp. JBR18]|uniref:DUF2066 domain-containing protein n=1 Tax=Pseudoxanthomonas sp. JBR18 TaxID=2969308 RepID=UPI002305B146|nr:DUF2066 domain-containing protein [Pseudoxanthomonas sp. JBR18]WCE04362.1 DUF2066 domain-containing protein [Pseudoxanthomonas sp. JBR18]
MRRLPAFAAAVFLFFCAFAASAQDGLRTEGDVAKAQGLYEAEATVASQGEADRNGGFSRALGQVLAKVSGDAGAISRPGVAAGLRDAKDYVESYDYRQDQGTSASGAPTFRTTLVVRFDQQKVDVLASVLGLSVWPQPRPKPVVWLSIDDGSGPRLVTVKESAAVRSLLDRAVDRGFRLGLPQGTAAETALVGAIGRGDTAAVARASARYAPPMQLIGKLYRGKSGWVADWNFVDNGKVLATWSADNADARQAMASGADGAADALVKRYAKQAVGGQAGTYRVVFAGIRSTEDYLRLSAALQQAPVVRRIAPVRVDGDRMEVDLDLLSGIDGLKRMLGDDGPVVGGDGDPPVFYIK